MHRPNRILTVTVTLTAAAALAAMLAGNADQLTPATLMLAAALALLAAATTIHTVVRPISRRSIDEAYVRGYDRASRRLARSR